MFTGEFLADYPNSFLSSTQVNSPSLLARDAWEEREKRTRDLSNSAIIYNLVFKTIIYNIVIKTR